MKERDAQILELTRHGLSARKVAQRLGLKVSVRKVQRVAQRELGRVPPTANSSQHAIRGQLLEYVTACMLALGKDPHMCEICNELQATPCDVHHTKYEGATLYDLMYACRSCNLARANRGLS